MNLIENMQTKQQRGVLMNGPFRFIDLFCGIGGIRIGMESKGFKCVFSCDMDAECQKTYEENFGEKPFGDIKLIDEKLIPDHEVLCAGFPCQPFSISGKQKGFEDTRGTLFLKYAAYCVKRSLK